MISIKVYSLKAHKIKIITLVLSFLYFTIRTIFVNFCSAKTDYSINSTNIVQNAVIESISIIILISNACEKKKKLLDVVT